MARLKVFVYQPSKSPLHRYDVRLKILAYFLLNAAVMGARPAFLAAAAAFTAFMYAISGLPLRPIASRLKPLFIIVLLLFLSRLSAPGRELLALGPFTATLPGLVEGTAEALKIILLVVCGHLFVSTTRPADIELVLGRLPLPGGPEAKSGCVMIFRLTLFLVPLLFDIAGSIREALLLRGFDFSRHPLRGLNLLGGLFMRRALQLTGAYAGTLETRLYDGRRHFSPPAPLRLGQLAVFLCVIAASTVAIAAASVLG
jgi:cobalt/nickel transport system permease protein